MRHIISELDIPKSISNDPVPGGLNVLNRPDGSYVDSLQFWNDHNKPFLDAAIARGDDIIMVTKPIKDTLFNMEGNAMTGFGREYFHLIKNGYIYDASTSKMIKP